MRCSETSSKPGRKESQNEGEAGNHVKEGDRMKGGGRMKRPGGNATDRLTPGLEQRGHVRYKEARQEKTWVQIKKRVREKEKGVPRGKGKKRLLKI